MATKTTNYNLTKPTLSEAADINVINNNMDKIDTQMFVNATTIDKAKSMMSDEYNSSLTYAVGDYCIHDNTLLKNIVAIDTPEEFDESKWEPTSINAEINVIKSSLGNMKQYLFPMGSGISITLTANGPATFILATCSNNSVVRYVGLVSFGTYSGAVVTPLVDASNLSVEVVDTFNIAISNTTANTGANVQLIRLAGSCELELKED